MSTTGIWQRNCVYFYLTFFSAGTQGIITQLFVQRHYAEYKETLLPLILIAGSIAYISGIWLSGKNLHLPVGFIKAALFCNFVGFLVVLTTQSLALYICSYVMACFACNFTYNYLDQYFIHSSKATDLGAHVKSMLSYQMLAFMLAPMFFSLSTGNIPLILGGTILVALVGTSPIFGLGKNSSPQTNNEEHLARKKTGLRRKEKIFVLYTMLFMAIVNMAASMMVYILAEYYKFPNYAVKSGICLMIMSLLSGLGILLLKSPESDAGEDDRTFEYNNFRPGLQFVIVLATLAMTLLLLLKLSDHFIFVAIVLSVLGITNGLFLSSTRKFAGAISVRENRRDLLNIFNNLQSISSLAAYGTCIGLSVIARVYGLNFYACLILIIITALLGELLLIFVWLHLHKQRIPISEFEPLRSK
jgi:hypothetical protein